MGGRKLECMGMVTSRLPCQHQLSRLDPMFVVIVPRGTKLDILCSFIVRKYSFHAFVELQGKSCNVFRSIEL